MSSSVLALFAKAPVPGQVKTRLSPPFSPEQAASLYEAMLLDILAQPPPRPDLDRALWFTPEAARPWFAAHAPGYRLYPQEGAELGSRMAALFRRHAGEGSGRIVLRGTDSPTLPQATITAAFDALESCDLVLCPDLDGGYNLVGLRGPADALFSVEMSTRSVLEQTCARARELGLRAELLPPHHDVDTVHDLELLEPDARTPRTARWLRELRDRTES